GNKVYDLRMLAAHVLLRDEYLFLRRPEEVWDPLHVVVRRQDGRDADGRAGREPLAREELGRNVLRHRLHEVRMGGRRRRFGGLGGADAVGQVTVVTGW